MRKILPSLAGLVCVLVFSWSTTSPASDDDAFNTNDRFLITNLISGYGYLFDEGKLADYQNLFTESARFYGFMPTAKPSSPSQVMEFLAARVAHFEKNGIQRRHFLGPIRFETQSKDEATGQVYLQLYSIEKMGKPQLLLTGFYRFTTIRTTKGWKIDRWEVVADSKME